MVFVVVCGIAAALGDCTKHDDGTGCEHDGLIKAMLFPGSLLLVISIGIFAAWRYSKGRG
jgi:hypothetical protein